MTLSKKNNLNRKPSATTLATPIYHRRRRDWRDDQYLIEEIAKSLIESKEANKNNDLCIQEFKDIALEIENEGYQSSEKATSLSIWIREQLSKLAGRLGSYDLRIHTIEIPVGITQIIKDQGNALSRFEVSNGGLLALDELFPDQEIRAFVLERIQLLHKGSLLSYLHSLVSMEKSSLEGDSATISDLIHICEQKLKRRKLKALSNFNANETDLLVPSLSLGIEVREALSSTDTQGLIDLLKNTNLSKGTKFLSVICPDDLSDLIFHSWREIERSNKVPNLSVLRVGDFGNYLDRLINLSKVTP